MGKKGAGRVRIKQVGPKGPINPLADLTEQEPIFLPPKPDSNITYFYPRNQAFTMNYKNNPNFPCFWPTYIDSNKTVKEGRRIGKENGGCVDCPTVEDISEVLQDLGVRHVIQPLKGYPRDVESRWDNPGRVLYDMTQMEVMIRRRAVEATPRIVEINDDDDDIPILDDDADNDSDAPVTQKQCWKYIASKIEGMPGRKQRLQDKKKAEEEEKKRLRDEARMKAVTAKKSSTGGSSKKKGKKKR